MKENTKCMCRRGYARYVSEVFKLGCDNYTLNLCWCWLGNPLKQLTMSDSQCRKAWCVYHQQLNNFASQCQASAWYCTHCIFLFPSQVLAWSGSTDPAFAVSAYWVTSEALRQVVSVNSGCLFCWSSPNWEFLFTISSILLAIQVLPES